MASILQKPILDPASTTILVTGASGFIATHIVNEALSLGYKVRGTARSEEKAAGTRELYKNSNYSTVIVTDFGKPSQEIDDAVKGVDSVIHVASDTTFGDNPEQVIGSVVRGTEAFLKAAANEKSVKRFTLTSSSSAAITPIPNKEFSATVDSWNEEAVDVAWNHKGESIGPNPYAFVVYAASKTEGERSLWKFVKEKKPNFIANSILPNFNTGRVLGSAGVTASMVIDLFKNGQKAPLPPQYYIDVVDDARLHLIAAVLDESVVDERIYAFATPFNWNDALDAFQKVRPDAKIKFDRDPNEGRDLSKVPNELGAKLLKKWYGQEGYKSFEQSIKENLEGV